MVFRSFYCNACKVFSKLKCPSCSRYIKKQYCTSESQINNLTELAEEVQELFPRSYRTQGMPHQVFIIQPRIKWGKDKRWDTNPNLQLDEATALISTLPGWKIAGTKVISLLSFKKMEFFNSGQLEMLCQCINSNSHVTALFINVESLKFHQHIFLENYFKVPVFNRYNIVINIFKCHAKTKEAKLQIALAEIPYLSYRIKGINEEDAVFLKSVGSGETFLETRLRLLKEQEKKIKQLVMTLRQNRELRRKERETSHIPIVAIVGYTNSGKTSLIKALTKGQSLIPENKLFATLDVTTYSCILPKNIKILLVDTIGFLSNLPSRLLEPFVATLEDALKADVIVHVQDISHPDLVNQMNAVQNTLQNLNLEQRLFESILTVGNKCDLICNNKLDSFGKILISCKENYGIDKLKSEIENAVIKNCELLNIKMRVKSGSPEYNWIIKETAVFDTEIDKKNSQYLFLNIYISKIRMEQFKSKFIRN